MSNPYLLPLVVGSFDRLSNIMEALAGREKNVHSHTLGGSLKFLTE